jgi:DNA-binding transcriptional LysR family regulator
MVWFTLVSSGVLNEVITRHLEYLTALAREKHFGRAAAACKVTQSTLSAGIKQLEEDIGVLIVERGQRFVGLTPAGAEVLSWAQRSIRDYSSLQQSLHSMSHGLRGQLRIGAIPVALPLVPLLTVPFTKLHTETTILIRSLSSAEIQRGLDDFSLDVGFTYLDNDPLVRVRRLSLHRERYMFVTCREGKFSKKKQITWREAAAEPLCLMTPDMQNRRILERHAKEGRATLHPELESNSLLALLGHLHTGRWATILPDSFVRLLMDREMLVVLPLVEPEASHAVGLVTTDQEPLPAMARAFLDVAKMPKTKKEIRLRLRPFSA